MNVSTYLTLATNAKVSNDKHQQAAKEDPWMIDFFLFSNCDTQKHTAALLLADRDIID